MVSDSSKLRLNSAQTFRHLESVMKLLRARARALQTIGIPLAMATGAMTVSAFAQCAPDPTQFSKDDFPAVALY